jgi:hypothetical protein
MKITIDTKEDQPEEIRKAIDMLMKLLELKSDAKSSGDYETPQPGLFNIFNDNPGQGQGQQLQKEDFNVGNYTEEQQGKDKDTEMRPYF